MFFAQFLIFFAAYFDFLRATFSNIFLFYFFDETFFVFLRLRRSELHLTKFHLAKIGHTNPFPGSARFYTGYASGINGWTGKQTHTHTLAQLYYR